MNTIWFGKETLKLKLDKIELACYLLDNGQHVFTKDSIQKNMGYHGKSEDWIYDFLFYLSGLTQIDTDLLDRLKNSTPFEIPVKKILKQGVLAADFITVCRIISKANKDGFLYVSELKFAKAADMVLKNTEGKSIAKLIDYATGFELFKQNHKEALSRYMSQTFAPKCYHWIKTFSDDFFELLFEMEDWNWTDLNKNAPTIGDYLNKIIFSRLDHGQLAELETSKIKMAYRKVNTPEKHLEHPYLKEMLGAISALLKSSDENHTVFWQLLDQNYPVQTTIERNAPLAMPKTNPNLQHFDYALKKTLGQ